MLPELGVGIAYSSALEPLLAAHPELIDVLEVEPQTTWIETHDESAPYRIRPDVQNHIAALPGHKLVHSVGMPVGGSARAPAAQLPLLCDTVATLGAPWASEHLSFNRTPESFTGFFLPPRQTEAGLTVCVEAIRRLGNGLGVPLAVETGVNYLRPRRDELPDGEFMAAVARGAECGILLDLHNVYCNERNGRQTVAQFLSQIPLERVWELHLAGGFEMDGFWLDAHSGAIPEPLERICRDVIPALPNLKAIVFEVFSSFLPHFGLDAVRRELEKAHELWALRRPSPCQPRAEPPPRASVPGITVEPADWELALGRIVIGRDPSGPLERELAADPGARLVQVLVKEFRASMVVAVYRLSCRLLMLALSPDVFRALLEDFWSRTPPQQFSGTEADAFADYIVGKNIRVPQLQSVLAFERAALATLRDGRPRVVRFNVDPLPMLRALADGTLLQDPGEPGEYEIEITDEAWIRIGGVDAEVARQSVPFH